MTVAEAFKIFKSELELPDHKQKETAKAQQEMRSKISEYLYISDSFLIGSYARYTKINPLNDIDVLLVLNNRRVRLSTDGSGILPEQALDQVVGAVRKAYPRGTVKKQSRSINVQLSEYEFGFDLIPGWLRDPDGYWIPDVDTGNWLPTNPEVHNELLTEANKRSGEMLKPIIKMIKHWSKNNHDLLRSFHIELICAVILNRKRIASYQHGVATALAYMGQYIGQTWLDPVYQITRVDKPLTQEEKQRLSGRVSYDADNAIDALKLEAAGNDSEAIEKWKHIFVLGFPK